MKINVLPKFAFEGVLKQIEDKNVDTSDMFFISIIDPWLEAIQEDSENYHTWWFYDVEEKIGNITPITEEQIQEIYSFIKQHIGKKECFVHCSAGVSRSGAVGTFINDLLRQDHKEFRNKHPWIHPNGRVLRLLKRLERADYEKPDTVC